METRTLFDQPPESQRYPLLDFSNDMTALRVGLLGDSYQKRSFTHTVFRNPTSAGGLQSMLLQRCFHNDLHQFVYQSKIQ